MSAGVLAEIPNLDAASLVTADQFTLIWVDNDVVDLRIVMICTLNRGRPGTSACSLAQYAGLTGCPIL